MEKSGLARVRNWLKMRLTGALHLTHEYQSRVTTPEEFQKLVQIRELILEILSNWNNSSKELGLKPRKNV